MSSLVKRMLSIAMGLAGAYHLSMAQSTGSAEDVLRQAVSALAGNDQAALTKLTIDQPEFKKYLWPALAMNMSTSNMSADKYYPTYQKANQAGIAETSTILAGKKWQVVKVDLQPVPRKGKGFQVYGPPLVTLRDESGQEKTVKLVGGLLERDGVYKVTTFYLSPSLRASK
jgi:hypothetical protein